MRLSTDESPDEELAAATIVAAAEAGMTVFDTLARTGATRPSSVATSGCSPERFGAPASRGAHAS